MFRCKCTEHNLPSLKPINFGESFLVLRKEERIIASLRFAVCVSVRPSVRAKKIEIA